MWQADINYLLVLLAGIISMLAGTVWYSPLLFGNEWKKHANLTQEKNAVKYYIIQFCATLLMSYIMALLVCLLHATSFGDGAKIGFWLWLGIAAPALLGTVLWERKSIVVYLIDVGHYLVSLVLMGGILGIWS